MRLGLAFFGLLAIVILPFIFWGDQVEALTLALMNQRENLVSLVIAALALDVLLPIPSSMVGTLAGAALGLIWGAMAIWVGLTLGCILAYVLGQKLGRPALDQLVGAEARKRTGYKVNEHAALYLTLFRVVPVLAEASVLSAGALSLPFARFLIITALANVPVAVVYAAIGALAVQTSVFWPAFGAVAITLLIYLAASRVWMHRAT